MAQRYGGKFSPDAPASTTTAAAPPANPFDGRRPFKAGARSTVLFFMALLFLPRAFSGSPSDLLTGLAATGLMLFSAWLTREGLKAEAAFDARTIARRPAFPRKMFGSALAGLSVAAGAFMGGMGTVLSVLFGLAAAGLHAGSFGLDPLRDKGAEGIDRFQTDRVARAVDEAEKHLAAMHDAASRIGERQILARVERFMTAARNLFRTVEADPRDLTAARKYLSVYLMGARDATVKFADLYARNRDPKAREDYLNLLDDLETTFADRSRRLLSDNRTDLDVEIDVLRERLKRET
jgi:hypothetical protein